MPTLEHRKVLTIGNSLAVTLPSGWVNYFQIKSGDMLEIVADDGLVIRPVHAKEPTTKEGIRDG